MTAKKLSSSDRARYLAQGGVCCPYCGSDDISVSSGPEFIDCSLATSVLCHGCKREWDESYELSQIFESDEEGG